MSFALAPPFRPARLLKSGHAQTIAGSLLGSRYLPDAAHTRRHVIPLEDGDAIVLHDDDGLAWQPGRPVVMLIHGLAGSYQSGYMQRIAAKLNAQGVRTFRYDMRGCGAAYELARYPGHSKRVSDVLAALAEIDRLCPGSPVTGFGFSLGGNLLLNTLAELGDSTATPLTMAIAVCPPIDLITCSGKMKAGRWRPYDRHFLRRLLQMVADRQRLFPDLPVLKLPTRPTSLWDFDDAVTAPLCGFSGAKEYYQATSPGPRLTEIRLPTLIVAAANDPLVPAEMFTRFARSPAVSLQITSGGGHLGFLSRPSEDSDTRWLDWRLVEWTLAFYGSDQSQKTKDKFQTNLKT